MGSALTVAQRASRQALTATCGSPSKLTESGGSRRPGSSASLPGAALRHRGQQCERHRGRTRRQCVVHRIRWEPYRRISPTGVITEFSVGLSPDSGPSGHRGSPRREPVVHAGRRQSGADQPDRGDHRFSTGPTPPSVDDSVSGIAVGSDGNMWFTKFGAPGIWRVTRAGTTTRFSTGRVSVAEGLAAGPMATCGSQSTAGTASGG